MKTRNRSMLVVKLILFILLFSQCKFNDQQTDPTITTYTIQDSAVFNETKKSVVNKIGAELKGMSEERINALHESQNLMVFGTNKIDWDFKIPSRQRDDNIKRIPKIASLSKDTTKFIRANWPLVNNTIDSLKKSSNGKNIFKADSLFGLKIFIYKLNSDDGEKLLDEWAKDGKKDDSLRYDPTYSYLLNTKYKGNKQNLIDSFYAGRLTVMAQLSYNDSSITSLKYDSIHTIFNVGRLCPPKCPPDAEI